MTSRCVSGTCRLECFSGSGGLDNWRDCNGLVDDGCETEIRSRREQLRSVREQVRGRYAVPQRRMRLPFGQDCVQRQLRRLAIRRLELRCVRSCLRTARQMRATHLSRIAVTDVWVVSAERRSAITTLPTATTISRRRAAVVTAARSRGSRRRSNCGGCGIKCKPHEQCINEGNGYECAVPCERFGKVLCDYACVDLMNRREELRFVRRGLPAGGDPRGLGERTANVTATCGRACASSSASPASPTATATPTDGCETNLNSHPGNCGACGNACDVAAGQPCVEGKCLMTECDAGGPK